MSFDLENLREMEKRAEELEAEVKALEQRKSELSNAEQRALEKEKYQLLLEEKRQLKQRKKEERKALKERRKERSRYEEPERSFFAKDSSGRNGIHKAGGFTFYAMVATAIYSVVSISIMTAIWSDPKDIEEIQVIRQAILGVVIVVFGIMGWKHCSKISLKAQFGFGIFGIITFLYYTIGHLKGINPDDKLNDALTPDSWEKKEDKPSQD